MKAGFIGAGRMGTSLGLFFRQHGYKIAGYYSKSALSAKRAAEITGSAAYDSAEKLAKEAQLLFITTPDSEIAGVCLRLSAQNAFSPGQIVLHTSGLLSSQVLSPAKQAGCFVYSLHPLQAVTGGTMGAENLARAFFTVEGDTEKMHIIEEILTTCGINYRVIQPEYKPLYHAAACIASNYLVTIIDSAISLFEKAGFSREESFRALFPLINGTLTNIMNLGTGNALTGPIKRGDKSTVESHLSSIRRFAPKELSLYRVLGKRTVALARTGKQDAEHNLKEIEKILGGKEDGEQVYR